jgi:hypothetical protein
MKNSYDTIENRTRDLPVCNAVPQPTAPPRPHITQSRVVIVSTSSWTSWPLKIGPIHCPETSVNIYHTTPRNIPEERKSQSRECLVSQQKSSDRINYGLAWLEVTSPWRLASPSSNVTGWRVATILYCLRHASLASNTWHPTVVIRYYHLEYLLAIVETDDSLTLGS